MLWLRQNILKHFESNAARSTLPVIGLPLLFGFISRRLTSYRREIAGMHDPKLIPSSFTKIGCFICLAMMVLINVTAFYISMADDRIMYAHFIGRWTHIYYPIAVFLCVAFYAALENRDNRQHLNLVFICLGCGTLLVGLNLLGYYSGAIIP